MPWLKKDISLQIHKIPPRPLNMRLPAASRNLFCAIFFVIFTLTFFSGLRGVHADKNLPAELATYTDALRLFTGSHKWGIVDYTHYPNGPAYLLTLFMRLGIEDMASLRVVVLFFSSTVLALFFTLLMTRTRMKINLVLLAFAFAASIASGMITNWLATLYEYSHQMNMVFVLILICYFMEKPGVALFFAGFLCGWIGYDFLPAQIITVVITRFIRYPAGAGQAGKNLLIALKDAAPCVAGALLAIIAHFVQNCLYFDSVSAAADDYIGWALTRAFLDKGVVLNPEFGDFLKSGLDQGDPTRGQIICRMFKLFLEWSNWPLLLLSLGAGFIFNRASRERAQGYWLNAGIVFILASFASIAWFVLMKYHSCFHYHFLPRLFYVGYINLIIFMYASNEQLCQKNTKD